MGENTAIAWCDHTHNPWWGCDNPLSPACMNCYARAWAKRCGFDVFGPPATTPRRELSDANWKKPLKWNREAFDRFGRRARVFHGSMCDLFEDHPQLPPLREREWDLIEATPNLEHLLLTKRIENVMRMVPERWIRDGFPEHVRVGITVENQTMADRRIPHLLRLDVPNFISMEPLLERVGLEVIPWELDGFSGCVNALTGEWWPAVGNAEEEARGRMETPSIDWAIVGFESGPKARRGDVAWIRDLVAQCKTAGTPVFVKQLGAKPYSNGSTTKDGLREIKDGLREIKDRHGADPSEWPEDLRVREYPTTEED